MAKGDRKFGPLWRVEVIDAIADGEEGWVYNQMFEMFQFRSDALNMKRTFLARLRHFLKTKGEPTIVGNLKRDLGRGWYYVVDDWECLELCRRSDHCPIYACRRLTP